MKKYILALLAPMMAMAVSAQTLTPQIEREFYQKAYDVIVGYAKNASMADETEKGEFKLLFENNDVYVCNDLMGVLLGTDSLTLYRYMQELKKTESIEVAVSNLSKKGDIVDKGNVWQMEVTFDKAISISTKDWTYFDSKGYFGDDYHIIATITMEKEGERRCYISRLRPDGEWPEFSKDYRVLVEKELDKRDKKLYINKTKPVKYNNGGQYILRPDDKVYYNRGEVDLLPMSSDENERKFQADYKDKYWRVRANGGYSLSGFNKVDGGGNLQFSDDGEMSFGVDFGYLFNPKSNLQTTLYAGIGISMNKVTMSLLDSKEKQLGNQTDEDGDTYTRIYKVWGNGGISQKFDATDITIPIYLDFEYQFTALYSAYANLGVRLQTSTAKPIATIDKYETWGVYSGYGGLTIRNCDENGTELPNPVVLNGFGMQNPTPIDVEESGANKNMAIDALAGAGVRLNLSKSLAFDVGVQYLYGFSKSWKVEGGSNQIFSYDGNNDKVNLLGQTDGIKHSALRLTASLIYKF